jgi:hypothetical protein
VARRGDAQQKLYDLCDRAVQNVNSTWAEQCRIASDALRAGLKAENELIAEACTLGDEALAFAQARSPK